MSSKTYFIAWDGDYTNCLNVSKQLTSSDLDYVFYNVSSYDPELPHRNWMRRPDIRYNSHFFSAVKDFLQTDHEVFIFNTGDIAWSDYVNYTKYMEEIFRDNPLVMAFAPNTTNDVFVNDFSMIQRSKKYGNLYISTNTNGSYLALRREIVEYLDRFFDWCLEHKVVDFSKMKTGWGLDMSYCSLIIYLNKIIYRDSGVNMYHPREQSYDQNSGNTEYSEVINAFKQFCQSINIDSKEINRIMDLTIQRVRSLTTPINLKIAYSNPDELVDM